MSDAIVDTERGGEMYLRSLNHAEVPKFLEAIGRKMEFYAFADAVRRSEVKCDGAMLCALQSMESVRNSDFGRIGSKMQQSLLAKRIRSLIAPEGAEECARLVLLLRCPRKQVEGSSGSRESPFQFQEPGDINTRTWSQITDVTVSDDGHHGVVFFNMGGKTFVLKSPENAAHDVFATKLLLSLNIPTAKQRVLTLREKFDICRGITCVSDQPTPELKTKMRRIGNSPVALIIEYVPGAEHLCGMAPSNAEVYLNPSTDGGRKRLEQLGALITVDALLNNHDRVPVVHSNVGNGRNVLFSGSRDAAENIDMVSIDHTMNYLSTCNEGKMKLFATYQERVRKWLQGCMHYDGNGAEKNTLRQLSVHAKLGKRATELCEEIKEKFNFDDRLAESCIRVAAFDRGMAMLVAEHPILLEYAQRRGPRICVEGSLLSVRDFIVKMCGYDVGEEGVGAIRRAVCTTARRIAALTSTDTWKMMKAATSESDFYVGWSANGDADCNAEHAVKSYIEAMLAIFRDSVAAAST